MTDFYAIETPPPSSSLSASKDSLDEFIALYQSKARLKLLPNALKQKSPLAVQLDQVSAVRSAEGECVSARADDDARWISCS